jgi:biopolymer transport protein ExbD
LGYLAKGNNMNIKKFETINVVPFIDIMLVLLVIVLTTATFVAKGIIPVDLPESSSAAEMKKNKDLTITLKPNGEFYFEKTKIAKEMIAAELSKYENKTEIRINCDKDVVFDSFIFVLDILKAKDFKNLGIITNNE